MDLKAFENEAKEYFAHNPKSKYVSFFMLSDYDIKEYKHNEVMLFKDDVIISIYNDNL